MNRKLIMFFFCSLFFTVVATGQGWPKRYFPPEMPNQLICYDFSNHLGGLICVNLSTPSTVYDADYCLIRISQNGDTIWTKKNLLNGPYRAIVRVIKQMPNGDYFIGVALGDTVMSPHRQIGHKFFRIDSNGNILSTVSKKVDRQNGQCMNVIPTDSSGYYLCYTYDSFVYVPSGTDTRVIEQSVIEKYSSSNVLLWSHRLFSEFSYLNYLYCYMTTVRTADDGIFYITQGRVGRLEANGTSVFERLITADLVGYSFDGYGFATSDTGVVISLFDTMQHFCKYNAAGAVVYNESVHRHSSYYAEGVEITNGKYLIAGGVDYPDSCGFYLFDKNMNKVDSIVTPYWDTLFVHSPLVRSTYGEAFYAGLSRLSLSSYIFHVFAAKVDTLFNNHRHLTASLTSNCLVPGYVSHLDIGLHNTGNTIVDTTITVILDSNTYYSSSTMMPISISGDTLRFAIDSLLPDSTKNFIVYALVDSTIGLGELLTFYAYSPFPNNIGITDDSVVYANSTVSSYDPNFKSVNKPFYFIPDNKTMIYTIGYENTGNFMARNIKILDTIDVSLDLTTIRILSGKPQKPEIIFQPNNKLIFNLSDVNLPDSASDPNAYHGQFTYAIELNTNAVLGDTIKNTANIIFDYNVPVVTNTTLNIISNKNASFKYQDKTVPHVAVFPNPSTGSLTIFFPNVGPWVISILDVYSRVIYSGNSILNEAVITTNAPNGIYFVKVSNQVSRETIVTRLIIKR